MPFELFWRGDIAAFECFLKKAHLDALRADQQAWTLGLYILDAIRQGLSSKRQQIYPVEPYLIKQDREKQQDEAEKAVKLYNNLKNWAASVSARMKANPSS